jgi:hypothetical protein
MFRLACTVQPKAWPAGGAVTVAGSGLTGTPAPPKNAPDGNADPAGVPDHRSGVSRTSTWPWAPAIVQAAAAGYQLRSPASLVSPVRGRMKAEPVNSPAKQAPGEWQTQQVLLGNKCP